MAHPSRPNDYLAKWREAERILAISEFTSGYFAPVNTTPNPPQPTDSPFPSTTKETSPRIKPS